MDLRKTYKNFLLLAFSLIFSFVLAELMLRIFTAHPINKSSNRVPHPVLNYTMDPRYEGIDANGFRNEDVVSHVDIAALGDSHTYGYNVAAVQSWPRQLAALSQKSVYNFGVGSYGMLQYKSLMDRAVALDPETIVLGFYLSNDLAGFYEAGALDYWKSWMKDHDLTPSGVIFEEEEDGFWSFLKAHSAVISCLYYSLYRKVVTPLAFKIKFWISKGKGVTVGRDGVLIDLGPHKKFILRERFVRHAAETDLEDGRIRRAFEAAKDILMEMKQKADSREIDFRVFTIPSVENVFYDHANDRGYELPEVYHQVVKNERKLRGAMRQFLRENQIEEIDPFSSLKEAIEESAVIYPIRDNSHPLAAGYAVYAQAVYESLLD